MAERRRPTGLGLVVGTMLMLASMAAVANPFTGPGESGAPEGRPPAQGSLLAPVGEVLLTIQRESNRLIAQHMRAIKQGDTMLPLLVGLGLAFAYGVVHALGPGHGKLVVATYFLSHHARVGRGLLMGAQIAVCHVIAAIIVVLLADLVLRQAFGGPPAEVAGVRIASYGLIALIGLFMLGQAVRRSLKRRAGHQVAAGCCGHGAGPHEGQAGQREQGALSLGVGMVPCTGAVLILLYAVANDIVYAGVLLVIAIALGMAITMGALGLLSIVARQAVASRIAAHGGPSGRFAWLAVGDLAGGCAITALGAGLFWAALSSG